MVLTPIFRLEQTDTKLKVVIHAPLAKISEMEVCVEDQTFDIPGSVVTDEDTFDFEFVDGDVHVTLEKSEPGYFKDLDLISKLLITSPAPKSQKSLIEELSDSETPQTNWSLDWLSTSENKYSTQEEIIISKPTYGFSGSKSGLFTVEASSVLLFICSIRLS
ncbi:unnamed protein product [Trichobilharzia regenti]|nr:unnamed protein product [Trichobilharzia regenti]